MATERVRSRCRWRLELLAGSAQDLDSLRREVIAELKQAIGFDRWCAPLIDPDSLIAHTGIAETDHLAELPRLQLNDASVRGLNNGGALARDRGRVGVLSSATSGDLARSRRWRESLEQFGTGDDARRGRRRARPLGPLRPVARPRRPPLRPGRCRPLP